MKLRTALIVGLTGLFMLSACKEETPAPDTDTPSVQTPAGGTGTGYRYPIYHPTKENYWLTLDFEIATKYGQTLAVTAAAYCESLDHKKIEDYSRECRAEIEKSLLYYATQRECFEGLVPAVSVDVRNYAGRPEGRPGCLIGDYPPNMSFFSEEMLRRKLEHGTPKEDLYTVTGIALKQ